MSIRENKACSRRVFEEIWNQGDLDQISEVFASNFVLYEPVAGEIRGPEGYKRFVSMYRAACPDLHFTVEDQVAEGDKVANRLTFTATHKGTLLGIPPTGVKITTTGITVCRYGGGERSLGQEDVDPSQDGQDDDQD